jgi:hypothetical protein
MPMSGPVRNAGDGYSGAAIRSGSEVKIHGLISLKKEKTAGFALPALTLTARRGGDGGGVKE